MRAVALIFAVASAVLLSGWFPHGAQLGVAPGWHMVRLGGGGLEVGSDFPPTGVRFVRTDAGGAYIWNTTTSKWSQIICQACIPVNTTPGAFNFGLYPTTGTSQVFGGPKPGTNNPGVVGIAGAPNDATTAYVFVSGHVLVSTTVDPANPQNIALTDTGPIYSTAVTGATWASTSGGQATFTVTRLANQFGTGSFFTVSGVTPAGFNGTYTAVSTGAGTVTGALVSNPGTFVSGGALHSVTSDYGISASRFMGQALAVDPNNKDHVIVSTQYDGVFETFNGTLGASATWAPISSSIPIQYNSGSQGTNLIALVAFDPNSGTTGGLTNTVYIWTPGAPAGLYKTTTTTTGTWSLMAGSPATAQDLKVTSATIGQGDLWVVDGSSGAVAGNVWQYTGGTWNNRIGTCCHSTSSNPLNGNQIVAPTPKLLYVSTNGGTSFVNYKAGITATDAPWQAWMDSRTSLTAASSAFDPAVSGQIWFTGGQGVWSTPSVPSADFNWVSTVNGIESLEALSGLAIAGPYKPVFGAQDEAGCQINVLTNEASPPASCIPIAASKPLSYFSNLYVPPTNPNFMVAKGNYNFAKPEFSGYSTDGFLNSYLPFNTWNVTVSTGAGSPFTNVAGNIQVTVPSTTGLTSWSPGNTGANNSILCAYATSVTRNPTQAEFALNSINFSCFEITVNDATHFTLLHSTYGNLGNPLSPSYVFFAPSTTLFSSWNGAFALTNIVDDGTGKIKVVVANAISNEISGQDPVCITGVTMTGATTVNGCWIVASSSSGNIVLQDSVFAGGDTYVSGGLLTTWNLPDGSIAAATDQNIVIAAADNGILQCSLDGGQTWTNNQPIPSTMTTITAPASAGATAITVGSISGLGTNVQFTMMLDDGRPFFVKSTGATGTTVNFTPAIPPGASVTGGAANAIYTFSGYGWAGYGNLQQLSADPIAANTFYAVNAHVGLYKWTNCGTPTLINANVGSWLLNDSLNTQVKSVPGENGHLFYSGGSSGSNGDPHPVASGLWRTCSASGASATMERVRGFFEVRSFGFGAPKPGSTYASEYVQGWYASDNVQADAVYGTWKSTDDPNHGETGACNVSAGAQTWTNIGGWPTGWNYPFDSLSGDPSVYGMVYAGSVSGWYYGYFP